MKFKICVCKDGKNDICCFDEKRKKWIPLNKSLSILKESEFFDVNDFFGFLQDFPKNKKRIEEILDKISKENEDFKDFDFENGIALKPVSLRDGSLFDSHMIQAARSTINNGFAGSLAKIFMKFYEFLFRKDFPMLKPKSYYYKVPVFYTGNHVNVQGPNTEVSIPSFCTYLDYEMEIAMIVGKELKNSSPETARESICGFVLFNDFSCRNMQYQEMMNGRFGFDKTKHFCNVFGDVVVTPDEFIPLFEPKEENNQLTATVKINGKVISQEKVPRDPVHHFDELLAYASMGVKIVKGEFIGCGTIPRCCGLEIGKQLFSGDKVSLELEPFGTLTNTIGKKEDFVDWQRESSKKKDRLKSGKSKINPTIFALLAVLLSSSFFLFFKRK